MLALCQQYRVPIVVDSDAHDPSWVGRQDLACALLESVGFDEELVLNADLARLKELPRRGIRTPAPFIRYNERTGTTSGARRKREGEKQVWTNRSNRAV